MDKNSEFESSSSSSPFHPDYYHLLTEELNSWEATTGGCPFDT